MENQHREIAGYRELNAEEIKMMNVVKEKGVDLGHLVSLLRLNSDLDQRWVSIGATHLQEGLMALTRAIAKPTFFVLTLGLALTGCSSTNISDLAKELAKDPAANCILVNAGPYGGITLARGTPNVSVYVSPGSCSIEGSGVTKVAVPTGNISVTPTK